MRQQPVYFVCGSSLFIFIKKDLLHDFFDVGIFTLYHFFFVASVHHMDYGNGMLLLYLLVILQKLYGMPSGRGMFWVILLHHGFQSGDFSLNLRGIIQYVVLHTLLTVVNHRVKQDIQSRASGGRHRYHRNISQHLRQTVHVDLHAALFYHIHHVQRQNHWFSQFQKLQGEIEIPFQGRGIHHIDNGVNVIIHGTFSGNLLFDGIAGQGVNPGGVHKRNLRFLIACLTFHPFHGDPGPVGHFQL